eukprot:6325813-Pyramimonas_sp.AAC.1
MLRGRRIIADTVALASCSPSCASQFGGPPRHGWIRPEMLIRRHLGRGPGSMVRASRRRSRGDDPRFDGGQEGRWPRARPTLPRSILVMALLFF